MLALWPTTLQLKTEISVQLLEEYDCTLEVPNKPELISFVCYHWLSDGFTAEING